MKTVKKILSGTSLLVRVVFLYSVVGLFAWGGMRAIDIVAPSRVIASARPVAIFTKEPTATIKSGNPTRLRIERIGIDLPVQNGTYDAATNSWSLSDDSAYFATTTAAPNDAHGNTFIYGHNTDAVLAKTAAIQPGDVATVATSNGFVFRYVYTGDTSVTPDKTAILSEDPATPQLTLMTCEGWWSATRRLMFFTLQGVTP